MQLQKPAIIIPLLCLVVVTGIVLSTFASLPDPGFLKTAPKTEGETGDQAELDKAAFKFEITDISRDGNVVSFTIPEDARALEKKADAVVLSGLYIAGKNSENCPVVQSDAVDKSVEHYNPVSGKARVSANFEDEGMAKAAVESGCLLINDPT